MGGRGIQNGCLHRRMTPQSSKLAVGLSGKNNMYNF